MRSLSFLSLFFVFLFHAQTTLAGDCSTLGVGWYWDVHQGSCQYVSTSNLNKNSSLSKKTTGAKSSTGGSSEAACRARLNGTNGCYSYKNGDCAIGYEYCSSEAMCKRNGGALNSSGDCADKNEASVSDNCKNDISTCNFAQCSLVGDWVDGRCIKVDSSKSQLSDNSAKPVVAEQDGIDFTACLKKLEDEVGKCDSSANNAKNLCQKESLSKEQQSSNSQLSTGQKALNTISNVMIGKKLGSGEVDTCVLTTLGTQTAWGVLEDFKEECATNVESCNDTCAKTENFITNRTSVIEMCKGLVQRPETMNEANYENELNANINAFIASVQTDLNSAKKSCEDANNKKSVLEETAGRTMSSAQQAAKVCNCQNVAGSTNCNNLPTMAQCKLTPGIAGCSIYQNNCVANPNSPACVCVIDPNGNACKLALNSNPNLQGMVSALNAIPSSANGSSVATGSPYNSSKSMKDLLGALSDEATKVASGTPEAGGPGSPFASAQGNGGPGGANGGSGGLQQQGEGGAAAEEERKGIGGGFITSAKNFLSDMFGGKKGGNSAGGGPGNSFKVKPNIDAWRPKLRIPGSAGDEYALGSKNKNIFDIMTKRYSDQTHTFIQTP